MDAVQNLPEQDSAEMRHDIDTTRAAMAEKLEALEDRMIGAAQSAQETVEDSIQSAKDAVASVKRTFDINHQVEERPWTIVGGCFVAGLAVSLLIPKGRPSQELGVRSQESAKTSNSPMTPDSCPLTPEKAEPASVFEPFREEIDKVKGIAIGFVMGLLRDSIKESVPQLAPKIGELIDGLTTKLGGEPVQRRST
jgi:ElaB/YqjD/DUF883 family membrane-anchored ribosome-binding protein